MEFIDHTGHIFSIKSFDEKPIGYEFDINDYIFWLEDDYLHKLSINNYYIKPIRLLLDKRNLDNLDNLEITIECNSSIFSLIGGAEINSFINSKNPFDNKITEYYKQTLYTKDLKYIDNLNADNETEANYICVPFYVIGNSDSEGTYTTNVLINVNYTEYCVISVGGIFYDETEELYINGKNMGIELPKDILRAIYQNSFYNVNVNEPLYYEKLKELLLNYMTIIGECGNYNSVINSLKWFGWGKNITVSKLIQTDNNFINQYLIDYFDISTDVIQSYNTFRNSTYISLYVKENEELDEEYLQDFNEEFYGEGKPKLQNLFDKYTQVTFDETNIPFYKSWYDYCFDELGLKLCALKYYYEKIFLPIHLKIHNASISHKVYINDTKFIVKPANQKIIADTLCTSNLDTKVIFNDNIYYISAPVGLDNVQIDKYYFDDKYNCFNNYADIGNIYEDDIFFTDDLCIKIPIEFNHKTYFKVYYNTDDKQWYKYGDNIPYYGLVTNKEEKVYELNERHKVEDEIDSEFYQYSIDNELDLTNNNLYQDDDENYFIIKKYKTTYKTGIGYEYVKYDDTYIYNTVLILKRNNSIIYESQFRFSQKDEYTSYNSFIIDIAHINDKNEDKITYWQDQQYELLLCVNGQWFNHKFVIKLPQTYIETGKLSYKYYLEYKSYNKVEDDNLEEYNEYIGNITPFAQICDIIEGNNIDLNNILNIESNTIINGYNIDINDARSFGVNTNVYSNDYKRIAFMTYMHEPDLVQVSDIDFVDKLIDADRTDFNDDFAVRIDNRNKNLMDLISKEYTENPNIHISDNLTNKVYYYNVYRRRAIYNIDKNYFGKNDIYKIPVSTFIPYNTIQPSKYNFTISFEVVNNKHSYNKWGTPLMCIGDTAFPSQGSAYGVFQFYLESNDSEHGLGRLLLIVNDLTYNLTNEFGVDINTARFKITFKYPCDNNKNKCSISIYNYETSTNQTVTFLLSENIENTIPVLNDFNNISFALPNELTLNNVHIDYIETEDKINNWQQINWKQNVEETSTDINNIDINKSINLFKTFYTPIELNQKTKLGIIYKFKKYTSNVQINQLFLYDMYLMRDEDGYYYSTFISQNNLENTTDLMIKPCSDIIYYMPNQYNASSVKPDIIEKNAEKMHYEDITNEHYEYKFVKFNEDRKFLINRMYINKSNGLNHFDKNDIIICYLENNNYSKFKFDFGSHWQITPYTIGITNDYESRSNTNICILSMAENNSKHISGYYNITARYSLDKYQLHQYINKAKILIK